MEKKNSNLILGFDGSPHKDGRCSKLLAQALKICEANGAQTESIKLIDLKLPFFHGNYIKTPPQGHEDLWNKISNAQGLLFATPVHWFTMSASMKNFIDWLTTFEIDTFSLEGKVAGVITTCEEDGGEKAITDIVGPLMHHGVIFPPYSGVFFNLKMNEKSEHDWMKKDIDLLAQNMLKTTKHLGSVKIGWGY